MIRTHRHTEGTLVVVVMAPQSAPDNRLFSRASLRLFDAIRDVTDAGGTVSVSIGSQAVTVPPKSQWTGR